MTEPEKGPVTRAVQAEAALAHERLVTEALRNRVRQLEQQVASLSRPQPFAARLSRKKRDG